MQFGSFRINVLLLRNYSYNLADSQSILITLLRKHRINNLFYNISFFFLFFSYLFFWYNLKCCFGSVLMVVDLAVYPFLITLGRLKKKGEGGVFPSFSVLLVFIGLAFNYNVWWYHDQSKPNANETNAVLLTIRFSLLENTSDPTKARKKCKPLKRDEKYYWK